MQVQWGDPDSPSCGGIVAVSDVYAGAVGRPRLTFLWWNSCSECRCSGGDPDSPSCGGIVAVSGVYAGAVGRPRLTFLWWNSCSEWRVRRCSGETQTHLPVVE